MTQKRPPVFFTVAAINHEPLLAVTEFLPKIQDDLRRKNFSGPLDVESIAIQAGTQTAQVFNSYTIFTPDRTAAFTFNEQGVFSYHTSSYTTRADLFRTFRVGLEVLHSHLDLKTVSRVGIRMLDLIRPSDFNHELADFVNPGLLGFRSLPCVEKWEQGIASLDQKFFDGSAEITTRFACLPDGFGINADLFGTVKGHSLPNEVTSKLGVEHGILDIDSGTRLIEGSIGRSFDLDKVMTELADHKDRISQIFRDAVTPAALETWGLAS